MVTEVVCVATDLTTSKIPGLIREPKLFDEGRNGMHDHVSVFLQLYQIPKPTGRAIKLLDASPLWLWIWSITVSMSDSA